MDLETKSKVLLSSRVRQLIAGGSEGTTDQTTAVVDISLPSEDDAVKMLLSTGGLTIEDEVGVPSEAYELVKLCNLLPLAISIAGKLSKELEMSSEASDWAGIVQVMSDEFAENHSRQSVEEAVISVRFV